MRPIYGCPEFYGLPDYAHGYYSQHSSWAFVPIDPMNVPTKFDALYLLGLRIHALVHLLTYLLIQLARAYKTGNISETVEDKAKVTINGLY